MISLEDVSKRYGRVKAIDALTLSIPPGGVVVVQGPSGSGKTTLLRLIAGLELPNEGRIEIGGSLASSPQEATPPYARGIGMVFQQSALWPHMTVAQNIRFALMGAQGKQGQSLDDLLKFAALEEFADRYPGQLSGGEARRVALARAVAAQPRRLLLDEPLTSLDPDLRRQLLGLIHGYVQRAQATLVVVTHQEQEAEMIGGDLLRMERGRIQR
jgi:iron(III) transport system ATP-binding protein